MTNINIDTSSQQYQNYVAGLDTLRAYLTDQLPTFRRLTTAQKKWVIQRHPLLKKALLLAVDLDDYLNLSELREELSE